MRNFIRTQRIKSRARATARLQRQVDRRLAKVLQKGRVN